MIALPMLADPPVVPTTDTTCATEVASKVVVLSGALETIARRAAARLVEEHGGIVRRGITRRTQIVVIGRRALATLGLDRVQEKRATAARNGAMCWSETTFLRRFGVVPAAPAGAVDAHGFIAQTRLDADTVSLLALFDVIEPEPRGYSLADVKTGRTVAALLEEGAGLADVVASFLRARRRGHDRIKVNTLTRWPNSVPGAPGTVVRREDGTIGLRIGADVADLDGQLSLPLATPAGATQNPTVDELFEAAEGAEANGQWDVAARLYRRCADLDRTDPTAPFNLANVLRRQGMLAEADLFLRIAVEIDPCFAEAWYNLAHVVEARGRGPQSRAAARSYLSRATRADPRYGDALYNLALMSFQDGDLQGAASLWRRYLDLDREGEWAKKARAGLALCTRRSRSA